jgi:hypothetical protein
MAHEEHWAPSRIEEVGNAFPCGEEDEKLEYVLCMFWVAKLVVFGEHMGSEAVIRDEDGAVASFDKRVRQGTVGRLIVPGEELEV